ncbi:carnitine dehydratase [Rhodococcus sp. ACPA4]|uniref:CaiB/BaiF CoA transferase family protein n=1 Tax=Rhodococcus sp. ACPA4 TaxID=2028571 RepID=UPI000BB167C7|nr:CoA transferase [Rhodococcus sp. ACPA4]PBC43759.1 carnitine dehydratase [Rhodococcus sp. ACPA4]
MTALEGVKVICLGQFYMAPYATMLMARFGADVIKIESPDGDPYRRLPTVDAEGMSVQFQFMNAGKRTISIDLKDPQGQEVFRELVRNADVLVQNLSPGAMDRFGLGYDELSAVNPRLIMASGTGFGSFGPYAGEPAMDLTIQARSAVMSTTGVEDGPPTRTGPSVVDLMAGTHLVAGVMTALYQRTNTGRGQHVEVSLQDAIIPSLTSNIAGMLNSGGSIPERTGNRHGGMAVAPYNAFKTKDGWITLLCPTQAHWQRLCELMEDPETDDPRFADMGGRCTNMDAVDAIVERWTQDKLKADLAELLKTRKIPCAPVISLPELMEDPHIRERGILREITDDAGTWMTLGSPILLSDSPMVVPARAGGLGEHTMSILVDEIGMTTEEVAKLQDSGVL